jgi:hypothetical protein
MKDCTERRCLACCVKSIESSNLSQSFGMDIVFWILLSGARCNDEFPKHRHCRWTSEYLGDLCLYLKVRMDEKPLCTGSCNRLLVFRV